MSSVVWLACAVLGKASLSSFAQTDVQAELERLAEEAERQFATGEMEEGGFAIE